MQSQFRLMFSLRKKFSSCHWTSSIDHILNAILFVAIADVSGIAIEDIHITGGVMALNISTDLVPLRLESFSLDLTAGKKSHSWGKWGPAADLLRTHQCHFYQPCCSNQNAAVNATAIIVSPSPMELFLHLAWYVWQ